MQCPVCPDTTLSMTTREGIEIDYCPQCRGVWLDRGELDKIIERSLSLERPAAAPPSEPSYGHYKDHDWDRHQVYYPGGKRRGFLGDLFDFD
jgi:Zn-finger nucleic acid-binding protein